MTKSKKKKQTGQVEDDDDYHHHRQQEQEQQHQQDTVVDPPLQKVKKEKTKNKKKKKKSINSTTVTSTTKMDKISSTLIDSTDIQLCINDDKRSKKNQQSSSLIDPTDIQLCINIDKRSKKNKKKSTFIDPTDFQLCSNSGNDNDNDNGNEMTTGNDNKASISTDNWCTFLNDDNEDEDPRHKHNRQLRRSSLSSRGNGRQFSLHNPSTRPSLGGLLLSRGYTLDDIEKYCNEERKREREKEREDRTTKLLDFVDPSARPSLGGSLLALADGRHVSSSRLSSSSSNNDSNNNNSMRLEDITKFGYEDTTTQLLDYVDPSAEPSLEGSGLIPPQQRQRQGRHRSSSMIRENSITFGAQLGFERRNSRSKEFAFEGRSDNFRITKNPHSMKIQRMEAYFYNHGMVIALYVLFISLQLLAGFHGAYQFTELGGYDTDDPILKVTLPIARAGGRLVTLNCAILLLTACKYCWTLCRTYIVPIIPIGFPIDDIMPVYHRIIALWIIVMGCIVHTIPQIINYSTKSIVLENQIRFWTFGKGFATTQLLITGTLLAIIFSTFYFTTLPIFRKTTVGFRWFWFFHMGGVATAYPLLLIHGTYKGRPIFLCFAFIPLLLYIFDITMRRSKITTTKVVEWKTHEDNGEHITELVLECPKNFIYTPGQYAELKFLPISTSEWHPFTIASAPNSPTTKSSKSTRGRSTTDTIDVSVGNMEKDMIDDDIDIDDIEFAGEGSSPLASSASSSTSTKKLVFYIKSAGRWTDALYNYASAFDLIKAKQSTMINIRGPHGAPAMNYFEYRHIIVIGSGIGVTPLLSIWKYLVNRGRTMMTSHCINKNNNKKKKKRDLLLVLDDDDDDDNDDDEFDEEEQNKKQQKSKIRKYSILFEKILESVTVSMILLCLFVIGETIGIILQMLGYYFGANMLGAILSCVALLVHVSNVIATTIVGTWHCLLFFKCWLELCIIIVDSFALWVSVCGLLDEEKVATNTTYFYLFGVVVALHAIRIFHIFYATLKPPKDYGSNNNTSKNTSSKTKGNQICSIQGVLVSKYYSGMRFFAQSLMPPRNNLSKLFSMNFYGTREKPKEDGDVDHDEKALIKDLMGSGEWGQLSYIFHHKEQKNKNNSSLSANDFFHSGRPDWTKIFLEAIAKAHKTNPKGETVGVFFCGAPAIAASLQSTAKRVTSQHQYSRKHLDGKRCTCKLIVHTENF